MPAIITMAFTPEELALVEAYARACCCPSRSDALRHALAVAAIYCGVPAAVRDAAKASRIKHKPRRSRRCIVIRDGAMAPLPRL